MSEFEDLLEYFIKEVSSQDPLKEFYSDAGVCDTDIYHAVELNKKLLEKVKIASSPVPVPAEWLEKQKMRTIFFLPISRKNLKQLFDAHIQETENACNFIIDNMRKGVTTISVDRLGQPNG